MRGAAVREERLTFDLYTLAIAGVDRTQDGCDQYQ